MINFEAKETKFVFLLLDGFSQTCFANATDTLQACNTVLGDTAYSWEIISVTGEAVLSSCGIPIAVNSGLIEISRHDTIMVCGGSNISKTSTKPILNWLRRQSRQCPKICALNSATYTLAVAGLLGNRSCTIHWENQDAFKELFPDVNLNNNVYTIDGSLYSCAGGISAIDMVLHIVSNDYGTNVADDVCDQLNYHAPRQQKDKQRISVSGRFGSRNPNLVKVIQIMEDNLEFPISPTELAGNANISTRQLERIFQRYMKCAPKRYYMSLRLEKARRLIAQTDISLINIAFSCGFSSMPPFSKWYRRVYGTTPSAARASAINVQAA